MRDNTSDTVREVEDGIEVFTTEEIANRDGISEAEASRKRDIQLRERQRLANDVASTKYELERSERRMLVDHPILDPESDSYDPRFDQAVRNVYNNGYKNQQADRFGNVFKANPILPLAEQMLKVREAAFKEGRDTGFAQGKAEIEKQMKSSGIPKPTTSSQPKDPASHSNSSGDEQWEDYVMSGF